MKSVPVERWREDLKKTRMFSDEGGSSFECSDYEGMCEDMENFISQAIKAARIEAKEEERKRIAEILRKEKETWANQSIGWKAVESVENAINKHQ